MGFARSVGFVTAINIGNAFFSVITVAATARYFGTSQDIEIYFAATLLLTTLSSICNSGQLSDLFLPIYHKIKREQSNRAAHDVCWVLVNNSTALIVVVSLIIFLLMDFIVGLVVPGFSDASRHQVVIASYWVLPLLYINVISAYFTTFINAEARYGSAELVSLGAKAIHFLCLICLVDKLGMWSLIVGLWMGALLRIVVLLMTLLRCGFGYRLIFRSPHLRLRELVSQIGYSYLYVACAQLFVVAINAGVSQLPQGIFAIFRYVQQLYDRTNGIFLRPVSLVFFTKASSVAGGRSNEMRKIADTAFGIFLAIGAIAIIYIYEFGAAILQTLLGLREAEAGNSDTGSTLLLLFFSLMLLHGLNNFQRKILLSLHRATTLYMLGSGASFIAAALAWQILPATGVVGISAAYTAEAMLMLVSMMFAIRKITGVFYFYSFEGLLRWSFAGVLFVAATYWWLPPGEGFMYASHFYGCLELITRSLLFVLGLLVVAWVVGIREIREIIQSAVLFGRRRVARISRM